MYLIGRPEGGGEADIYRPSSVDFGLSEDHAIGPVRPVAIITRATSYSIH